MSYSLPDPNSSGWLELRTPDGIASARAGGPGNLGAHGYLLDVFNAISLCSPTWAAVPVAVNEQALWEVVPLSADDCVTAMLNKLSGEIDLQVGDTGVAATLEDSSIEIRIIRQQAAASDKHAELDATADADLGDFDPTLDVSGPQADVGYARLSIEIAEVTPRAGFPDRTMGWVAVLKIEKDYAVDGADARLSVTDAPTGPRGPLPFAVDPEDPLVWRAQVEDGYQWEGDTGPVSCVLRWGSGSVVVGRKLTSRELYNVASQNVRYGVPAGGGRKKPERRR